MLDFSCSRRLGPLCERAHENESPDLDQVLTPFADGFVTVTPGRAHEADPSRARESSDRSGRRCTQLQRRRCGRDGTGGLMISRELRSGFDALPDFRRILRARVPGTSLGRVDIR